MKSIGTGKVIEGYAYSHKIVINNNNNVVFITKTRGKLHP